MAFTVTNIIYKSNGDLIGWGNCNNGQLGIGDVDCINDKKFVMLSYFSSKYITKPILIMHDEEITQIKCGAYHTIIYKSNGDLVGFGKNDQGQLGIDNMECVYTPTLIINDKNIKKIYCGAYYTIVYKYNGDFLYMGRHVPFIDNCSNKTNNKPVLLFNDTEIKKIICSGYYFIIYRNNGQVVVRHQYKYRTHHAFVPFILTTDMDIKTIKCGAYNTLIYKNNGDLFIFGDKLEALNIDSNLIQKLFLHDPKIDKIMCGGLHHIIKKGDDYLSFGLNNDGQLGLVEDTMNKYKPTLLINSNDILKIISGYHYSMIYKNNGDLIGFGNNNYGQLLGHTYSKNLNHKLLMNEPDIISINGKKINIKWNKQLFNKLNIKIKQQILTFMMVKHIYNKLYGIYIVPYMRDCIINLFINK